MGNTQTDERNRKLVDVFGVRVGRIRPEVSALNLELMSRLNTALVELRLTKHEWNWVVSNLFHVV